MRRAIQESRAHAAQRADQLGRLLCGPLGERAGALEEILRLVSAFLGQFQGVIQAYTRIRNVFIGECCEA